MFEWLKNKGHSRKTAKTEQITAPQDKPENTRETALTEAELALVTRWLPIEKFEKFSEDMKKFFLEAEQAVTQSEYGLELSYLYIGSDGHAEFAYYDCDMTPPSMYEEVFDLTFNPEESEKLFRALGIGEDVIAHGGTELIVCAFRALMRFVVERRDSLLLSDEFPELLKKYGIRTASDYDELRKLWPGSPFNYERDDAQGGLTL